MAMVAVAAIGAAVSFASSMAQASAQAENARIQQLYANRAAEQRRQELDFQNAQLRNRKIALEQDKVARQKAADAQEAKQVRAGRTAEGKGMAAAAANGFLVNEFGNFEEGQEGTNALLMADIEVANINIRDEIQFKAALDARQFDLSLAENDAAQASNRYSFDATIADHVAPGPNKPAVALTSLVNGASSIAGAAYDTGYLSKNTFTGGGTFTSTSTSIGPTGYSPNF